MNGELFLIFQQCITYFIALFLHSLPPALKMLALIPGDEGQHFHVHDGLLEHHFWDLAKLNSNFPLQSSHVLMFAG